VGRGPWAVGRELATPKSEGRLEHDPYGHEYHRWDHDEDVFYRRWELTTNRSHMDFHRRSTEDQRAYWGWRHH